MDIDWADGHSSHYEFAYLREECPCATCNENRAKAQQPANAQPASVSATVISSPALPMFKPKVRAQSASQVGNYAVQLHFNDGHSSGIYSYEHLRGICPCPACAAAFRIPPQ